MQSHQIVKPQANKKQFYTNTKNNNSQLTNFWYLCLVGCCVAKQNTEFGEEKKRTHKINDMMLKEWFLTESSSRFLSVIQHVSNDRTCIVFLRAWIHQHGDLITASQNVFWYPIPPPPFFKLPGHLKYICSPTGVQVSLKPG